MAVQFSPHIDDGPESPPVEGDSGAPPAHRMPAEFPAELFGRGVPDDLAHFSPEQLATIAAESWAFLAQRSPGTAKVRLASDVAAPGVTLLDIANDDMPFLVNSVAGELHERGLGIALLVHPVFSIERDAGGNLIGLVPGRDGNGRRESFIHIHIDGSLEAAARDDLVTRPRSNPRRGPRVRYRLAGDAGARPRCHRRSAAKPAAAAGPRYRRGYPVSGMARRRQFHPARRARLCLHQ